MNGNKPNQSGKPAYGQHQRDQGCFRGGLQGLHSVADGHELKPSAYQEKKTPKNRSQPGFVSNGDHEFARLGDNVPAGGENRDEASKKAEAQGTLGSMTWRWRLGRGQAGWRYGCHSAILALSASVTKTLENGTKKAGPRNERDPAGLSTATARRPT